MAVLTPNALFKADYPHQEGQEARRAITRTVADGDFRCLGVDWRKQLGRLICKFATLIRARVLVAAQERPSLSAKMTVAAVTPSRISDLTVKTVQLIVLGTGLDRAESVKLTSGTQIIEAVIVRRNACALTLSFAFPMLMGERWTVILSSDNEEVSCSLEFQLPSSALRSASTLMRA